jgi:hypothetical protein
MDAIFVKIESGTIFYEIRFLKVLFVKTNRGRVADGLLLDRVANAEVDSPLNYCDALLQTIRCTIRRALLRKRGRSFVSAQVEHGVRSMSMFCHVS